MEGRAGRTAWYRAEERIVRRTTDTVSLCHDDEIAGMKDWMGGQRGEMRHPVGGVAVRVTINKAVPRRVDDVLVRRGRGADLEMPGVRTPTGLIPAKSALPGAYS